MSSIPNPALNPPLFPKPGLSRSKSRSPSRSPSHSPVRQVRNISRVSDSLLRDLSPTSTLRAFTSSSSVTAGKSEDQLVRSIETASGSDRAFGVRVAQTCKDLRAWALEVETWDWPGTFEPPAPEEKAAIRKRLLSGTAHSENEALQGSEGTVTLEEEDDFWGSLPKQLVEEHEARIEDITEAMEELDVDSLKDHIRSVHANPQSSYDPRQSDTTRLNKLDDFTALVTATILQSLPYISRLNRLLDTWSVRLNVLRKVPGYIREISEVKAELAGAWEEIAKDAQGQQKNDQSTLDRLRERHDTVRYGLESRLSFLGQRLDSMLDDLEGQPETLPEKWIDSFETLESTYGDWAVDTDRKVMEEELRQSREPSPVSPLVAVTGPEPLYNALGIKAEQAENPFQTSLSEGPVSPLETNLRVSEATMYNSQGSSDQELESPILGHEPFAFWGPENSSSSLRNTDPNEQDMDESELMDRVISESQDQSQMHDGSDIGIAVGSRPPSSMGFQVIPPPQEIRQPSPPHSTSPPRSRSRHVPIDVDAYREMAASAIPIDPPEDEGEVIRHNPTLALPQETRSFTADSITTRTARLRSELERSQSLQKTKSPVRPFEHASQAFTKLFSRSNSQRHSRSSSNGSRTSIRRIMTPMGTGSGRNSFSGKRISDPAAALPPTSAGPQSGTTELPDEAVEVVVSQNRSSSSSNGSAKPSHRRERSYNTTSSGKDQGAIPEEEGYKAVSGPRRFDSPFMPQDFSDNWPLPLTKGPKEEITSPDDAIKSDFFERMFVDSLPTSPVDDAGSFKKEENPMDKAWSFMTKPVGAKEPSLNDRMLSNDRSERPAGDTVMRGSPARMARQGEYKGNLAPGVAVVSEATTPGSLRSTLSTPEIRDASAAGYFRPMEVHSNSPPALSRYPSNVTARPGSSKPQGNSNGQPQSPPRLVMPDDRATSIVSEDGEQSRPKAKRMAIAKRASITSIEHFARADLKTIEVTRNASVSSADMHHYDHRRRANQDGIVRETPVRSEPSSPVDDKTSLQVPLSRSKSLREKQGIPWLLRTDTERSMIADDLGATKPYPLDLKVAKRRQRPDTAETGGLPSSSSDSGYTAEAPATPAKSPKRRPSLTTEKGDVMDRHVSNVLQTLPARIRFTPIPSTGHGKQNSTPSADKFGSNTVAAKSPRIGAGLTLAPATESSPRKSAKDPDIKLYHLSQPGREQPIKLFVRLVGENERVMVRVGGGWADLGEYLRQYAEHHGRRTVSSSQIELKEASTGSMKTGGTNKTRTPLSRPGSVLDTQRPESALSKRGSFSALQTPDLSHNTSPTTSPVAVGTPNYTYKPAAGADGTPQSMSSKSASRPSTAGGGASRPESRQSWIGDEVGLAGPAGKRGGVLDQAKAKWVEEMVEKAKTSASAERRKRTDDKSWPEIGGIGKTKRVLFKAGQEQ